MQTNKIIWEVVFQHKHCNKIKVHESDWRDITWNLTTGASRLPVKSVIWLTFTYWSKAIKWKKITNLILSKKIDLIEKIVLIEKIMIFNNQWFMQRSWTNNQEYLNTHILMIIHFTSNLLDRLNPSSLKTNQQTGCSSHGCTWLAWSYGTVLYDCLTCWHWWWR